MSAESEMPTLPDTGLEIVIKEKGKNHQMSTWVNGCYFSLLGTLPAAIKSK